MPRKYRESLNIFNAESSGKTRSGKTFAVTSKTRSLSPTRLIPDDFPALSSSSDRPSSACLDSNPFTMLDPGHHSILNSAPAPSIAGDGCSPSEASMVNDGRTFVLADSAVNDGRIVNDINYVIGKSVNGSSVALGNEIAVDTVDQFSDGIDVGNVHCSSSGFAKPPSSCNVPPFTCPQHAFNNAPSVPAVAAANLHAPALSISSSMPRSWSSLFKRLPRNAGEFAPMSFDLVYDGDTIVPPKIVLDAGCSY